VQWVVVTRAGGAKVAETYSADGRGVTPLQGALFRHFVCFSGFNQRFCGRYLFSGISDLLRLYVRWTNEMILQQGAKYLYILGTIMYDNRGENGASFILSPRYPEVRH